MKEFKLTARCFYCHQTIDYTERFWSKVDKTNRSTGCWLWKGSRNKLGYGHAYGQNIFGKKVMFLAHRVAFQLVNGSISNGASVLHICDVPSCVNPDHLYLGNQADNVDDMRRRNRSWWILKTKLNDKKIADIRKRAADGEAHNYLATEFKVSRGVIYRIISRRTWKHIP